MTGGRPLRFLLFTLGGWTAIRAALLWTPEEPITTLIAGPALAAARPAARPAAVPPSVTQAPRPAGMSAVVSARATAPTAASIVAGASAAPDVPIAAARLAAVPAHAAPVAGIAGTTARPVAIEQVAPFPLRPAPASGASRLAGSAWAILRAGGEDGATGGRLGGAQAGARLTYALGASRRVAVAARVSTPLAGRGREVAIGLDWRPTRLPLHVIAEQRVPIGGGRSGPALSLVGGLDPLPVAGGFRLEAYGQAGVVADAGRFADGAVRLARPVARTRGLRLDLGLGLWGGAQRGAARLDVGPGASLAVPTAARTVRLTLDYRRRIAGRASPGSGPVLSIGSDF